MVLPADTPVEIQTPTVITSGDLITSNRSVLVLYTSQVPVLNITGMLLRVCSCVFALCYIVFVICAGRLPHALPSPHRVAPHGTRRYVPLSLSLYCVY